MRKFYLVLIIVAMLFIALPPVQAAVPSTYSTSVNVTNLSDQEAVIDLVFYNLDGSEHARMPDTLEGFETKSYTTLPVTSGFDGSMVIESNQPLASMAMLSSKRSTGSSLGYASYIGTSVGSPTVYLPLLMSNNYGYHTFFYVQNTSANPIDVSIQYSDGLTAGPIVGLEPGASTKIDNRLEPGHVTNFSGIVTATGDIAVVVVEYSDGQRGVQLYSYNGFTTGSLTPIFSMINENNYGYWTSANIQNMGTEETTVTLTYTPTIAGTSCTETQVIPPGEKRDFATYAFAWPQSYSPYPITTNCTYKATFIGSAIVTGNSTGQPLVGIDNQINTSNDPNKGAALMSLNPDAGTDTVVFPYLHQWTGTWSWWTSMNVINVSGDTLPVGDIECSINGTDPSGVFSTVIANQNPIADGTGWLIQFFWNNPPLPEGFIGGAVCKSASGSEIVGTMNILAHNAGKNVDTLAVYEGINP